MTIVYPSKDLQNLIDAMITLKTPIEIANFLRDLMTVKELADISQRWQIVLLLNQKVPYLEIAKQVGVSTTTVTRVALWLHHGKDGYKTALSRLENTKYLKSIKMARQEFNSGNILSHTQVFGDK